MCIRDRSQDDRQHMGVVVVEAVLFPAAPTEGILLARALCLPPRGHVRQHLGDRRVAEPQPARDVHLGAFAVFHQEPFDQFLVALAHVRRAEALHVRHIAKPLSKDRRLLWVPFRL